MLNRRAMAAIGHVSLALQPIIERTASMHEHLKFLVRFGQVCCQPPLALAREARRYPQHLCRRGIGRVGRKPNAEWWSGGVMERRGGGIRCSRRELGCLTRRYRRFGQICPLADGALDYLLRSASGFESDDFAK